MFLPSAPRLYCALMWAMLGRRGVVSTLLYSQNLKWGWELSVAFSCETECLAWGAFCEHSLNLCAWRWNLISGRLHKRRPDLALDSERRDVESGRLTPSVVGPSLLPAGQAGEAAAGDCPGCQEDGHFLGHKDRPHGAQEGDRKPLFCSLFRLQLSASLFRRTDSSSVPQWFCVLKACASFPVKFFGQKGAVR